MKSDKLRRDKPPKKQLGDSLPMRSGDENDVEIDINYVLSELQDCQTKLEMQKAELDCARAELQESRDKYKVLYDFAPAGYVTLDREGIIIEANLTLVELMGCSKSDLIGSELVTYIMTDFQHTFVAHLKSVLSTGIRQNCELQMKKSDSSFCVRMESVAVRDAGGSLSQCCTTITDITHNVKHDDVNRYQSTVADISHDAIIATDKELYLTHWNKAAESLFGWQAQEVIGTMVSYQLRAKVLNFLNDSEAIKSITARGSWTGKSVAYKKDGSELDMLVSTAILWDDAGNFSGIVAIYYNLNMPEEKGKMPVTEEIEMRVRERTEEYIKANRLLQQELSIHKQAALLAKESEGRNRDLVDNIKLGIFRCTPGIKGKFLEVNKAMEEISGYSRDELLQIDLCNLYDDIQGSYPFTNEVTITDWKVTRELILIKKDGSKITISETVVAIRFDSGVIQYFDGILEDITERKQAQQQIQQSLERLQKTIKEIIRAMAYIGEVRDPYTAGHQRRVAQLSLEIARLMGLNEQQYEGLTMAAFVHDIGKIIVPADILSKPGKLTKPEFDMLKDHARIGYEILKTIEFPWPIANIVLQHHERMNGSGYPSSLTGDQIIIEARILAVADVVEAMSSHRPYRPALGIEKALSEISTHKGILYDPEVVDACIELFNSKTFDLN